MLADFYAAALMSSQGADAIMEMLIGRQDLYFLEKREAQMYNFGMMEDARKILQIDYKPSKMWGNNFHDLVQENSPDSKQHGAGA